MINSGLDIRLAEPHDADELWAVLEPVIRAGDTYPFDPQMHRDEALALWINPPRRTYVAVQADRVVGTYYLKPNQPALGAHVANAGYMVAPDARGRGVGRAMAEHSVAEARSLGYRAMQFNLVVSTNAPSVALWHSLGFQTVGSLPGAFLHPEHSYVDAYVMYRQLTP